MEVVNLFKHYVLHSEAKKHNSEAKKHKNEVKNHENEVSDAENFEVSGVFSDTREVLSNSVFVALRGAQMDGHKFIAQAIEKGARALVVEDLSAIPNSYQGRVYLVLNARRALSDLAARFYDHPSLKLRCIGVTGTNGKSSTVLLLEHLLNAVQVSTGVIGTIDHHYLNHRWSTGMTTPGPMHLQHRLKEFLDLGAKAVAMEVSSHGLEQNRVDHIAFQTV
ncbi:MAG TPA: Mur ligase family protein, partial [Pseudobdellovibrionaceae bacterium]|nr:Mur ligase family protein [Pseudobdellovibrionaceae bacterium]